MSARRRSAAWLVLGALSACASSAYVPMRPLTPTHDEPHSQQPPPALATRPPASAVVEQVVLANGMRVLIVQRGSLPIALVRYVSREAGDAGAPAEQAALPSVTLAALVGGGTALANGQEMRDVHLGGMPIATWLDEASASLGLRVGSNGVEDAIGILAQTVMRPTFTELGPVGQQLEGVVAASWNRVSVMDERLLQELLFGKDDTRAVQPRKWLQTLHDLGPNALRAWHARYRPESSALLVVGRVDPAAVRAAAQRSFGAWQPSAPAPSSKPVAAHAAGAAAPGAHVLLNYADAPSVIELAYPAVAPSDPDYWGLELLARVLAGTPTTPTFMALRHRSGLAYGVRAFVSTSRADGQLRVSTVVQASDLAESLALLDGQVERLAQRPIPDDELAAAKHVMLESLDLSAETNQEVANMLQQVFVIGAPLEVLAQARARIEAITPEQLAELAARYLSREGRVLLISGRHPPSDPQLRGLQPKFYTTQGPF